MVEFGKHLNLSVWFMSCQMHFTSRNDDETDAQLCNSTDRPTMKLDSFYSDKLCILYRELTLKMS